MIQLPDRLTDLLDRSTDRLADLFEPLLYAVILLVLLLARWRPPRSPLRLGKPMGIGLR